MVVHSIQLCKVGQKKRVLGGKMSKKVLNSNCLRQLKMTRLTGNTSKDEKYLPTEPETVVWNFY